MIALIQRVSQAKVDVNGETIGKIGKGLLVLLGVEKEDNREKADKLAEKVLNYRIFSDENDKMNLNVQQAQGELLIVSQFTLAADTQKGLRPSFQKVRPQHWLMNYMNTLSKSAQGNYLFQQGNLQRICK